MLNIDFPGLRVKDIVDRYDEQTAEHCKRVGLLAGLMGRSLRMTNPEIKELCIAGLIHDIGMTAIPLSVIMKPGPLSTKETQLMMQHPQLGADIATEAGHGEDVVSAVLSHHERLDGSGYPEGLKADSLNTVVKIVSICDVFSALTSPRPFRDLISKGDAMHELRNPEKFDQKLVDVLARVINMPHQFAANINQR